MKDPDNNPNIHGTSAHQRRVEYDKGNVDRGISTPSTREGRNYSNSLEQEKRRSARDPDHFVPPPETPLLRRSDGIPLAGGVLPARGDGATSSARRRAEPSQPERNGNELSGFAKAVCVIAGVLGAGFGASHGVKSGLGMFGMFVVAFVVAGVLIRYARVLGAIAFGGFLLYEIVHQLTRH